jgi:RNA polymerase sigma factor (TIGR02999 family)
MVADRHEVTRLLDAWSGGDAQALERLLPLVMDDLRGLARGYMARENPGHTLVPTALVHEAYLRLAGRRQVQLANRVQFFAVLALTMRRILVDHARRKKAARHGGGAVLLSLEGLDVPAEHDTDLVALDAALESLAAKHPRKAKAIELSYFGGLSFDDIALVLEVSPVTVKRELKSAKMWLLNELRGVSG